MSQLPDPELLVPLERELVMRAADDWLSLYELPYYARELAGARGRLEERAAALAAIATLLNRGLWEAGHPGRGREFLRWPVPPESALARIAAEWRPAEPTLEYNDICWFANTALGEACATALRERGFETLDDDDA